jgi:hypothetical protein
VAAAVEGPALAVVHEQDHLLDPLHPFASPPPRRIASPPLMSR